MKVLKIYLHCVADATRGLRNDVIPALKGWAKFTPTLRVATTDRSPPLCEIWGKLFAMLVRLVLNLMTRLGFFH